MLFFNVISKRWPQHARQQLGVEAERAEAAVFECAMKAEKSVPACGVFSSAESRC